MVNIWVLVIGMVIAWGFGVTQGGGVRQCPHCGRKVK